MAWTESQFKAQLRAEGWECIGQGQYRHPNVKHDFECWKFNREHNCEEWRVWADREQTPPPF